MGKRETQIILKTEERNLLLEVGGDGKFDAKTVVGAKTEFSSRTTARGRGQERALVLTRLPAGLRPAVEPVGHYFDTE
jgi:hypothetical protein